jgi:hypothetical protein
MPDNDIVPRILNRHWYRPFQAALDGMPAADVGDEIRSAVAAALRDAGGCLGLEQLVYAARSAAVFGDLVGWERERKKFEDKNGRNVLARTMANEAENRLGVDRDGLAAMRDEEACRVIAEAGLERWVDERMWGRGRDLLLEQYGTYDESRRFELAATEHASLPEMAERLLKRPDATGLRAPGRKLARRPTASLLHEALE